MTTVLAYFFFILAGDAIGVGLLRGRFGINTLGGPGDESPGGGASGVGLGTSSGRRKGYL